MFALIAMGQSHGESLKGILTLSDDYFFAPHEQDSKVPGE
jgi:hypothetical protein